MKFIIYNHYWSNKFSVTMRAYTPLGANPSHTFYLAEISKQEYIKLLKQIVFMSESILIKRTDDGKNKIIEVVGMFHKSGF